MFSSRIFTTATQKFQNTIQDVLNKLIPLTASVLDELYKNVHALIGISADSFEIANTLIQGFPKATEPLQSGLFIECVAKEIAMLYELKYKLYDVMDQVPNLCT